MPKGGTGKTTTAVNGARILASLEDTKVLLIDANAQQADAAETLYVNESAPTIVDLTFDDEPITRETVYPVVTVLKADRFYALFGPRDPRQADPTKVTPQLYTEALDAIADDFDYVLIDAPIAESYRDIIKEFILPRADFLVNVVTPNWITVHEHLQVVDRDHRRDVRGISRLPGGASRLVHEPART